MIQYICSLMTLTILLLNNYVVHKYDISQINKNEFLVGKVNKTRKREILS